jgi:hypothetical protein
MFSNPLQYQYKVAATGEIVNKIRVRPFSTTEI